MPQIFVSYSRVDSTFVDRLIKRIQQGFPDLTIWHDQSPHGLTGGDNWWEEILKAIAASDVFVYVLSNESIKSLYCQAEFTEARRLQKRIITIQARDKTELTDELDDIQFIDMKDGSDDPDAYPRLVAALNKQLGLAKNKRPLWKHATPRPGKDAAFSRPTDAPEVTTPPLKPPAAEDVATKLARQALYWQIAGVAIAIVAILVGLVPPLLDRLDNLPPSQAVIMPSETSQQIAQAETNTETPSWTLTLEPSSTPSPIPTVTNPAVETDTPAPTNTFTPTHTTTSTLVPPTFTISVQSVTTQAPTATHTPTATLSVTNTTEPTMMASGTTATGFPCQANIVSSESQVLNIVRSSPSDSSPAVIGVIPNEPVLVLGISRQNTRTYWYQIARSETEALGWIAPRYLMLSALCPSQ